MTKDETKCNSGEGNGIDGAALNQAAVLMSAIGEKLFLLADTWRLDLTVTEEKISTTWSQLVYTVTDRRTGTVMSITREANQLRKYMIGYSHGRDAGIAESIDRAQPYQCMESGHYISRDDWKNSEAAKEIVELGEKMLHLLKMGDGTCD